MFMNNPRIALLFPVSGVISCRETTCRAVAIAEYIVHRALLTASWLPLQVGVWKDTGIISVDWYNTLPLDFKFRIKITRYLMP